MRSPYTEEFDPRSWWWDSCCAIFAEVGANNFVPFSPPAMMSEGTQLDCAIEKNTEPEIVQVQR